MRRFALVLTGFGLTACSPSTPPPPPDGAAVYAMACRRCHGAAGAGDGALAARLGPIPSLRRGLPSQLIRDVVLSGRGAMPSHRARLSIAQIEAVVAHVHRWTQ